jgi:hypothetical protein
MAFTNTAAALRQTGGLVVQRLAQELQENGAIASGELESSISFEVKSTAKKIVVDIYMADYWGAVDTGRPAGKQPPIDKIKEWLTYPNVRDKLKIDGSNSSIGIRVITNRKGERKVVSDVDSLAFLIARKIGKQGTKGTNFATNVFTSSLITKELPEVILNAVVEDADSVLTELLDSFS